MKLTQLELDFEGLEVFEQSEDFKQAKKEMTRGLSREHTAERRLYGTARLRRRKKSKKASTEIAPPVSETS